MDLHEIDALLGRCETVVTAMSASLLALEETPAFVLIRHTTFTGVTAQRFASALAAAPALWDRAAVYAGTVSHARALRDADRRPNGDKLREITQLLTGPSTIDPTGAAGPATMSARRGGVTLAELSGALDTTYAAVTDAVRTIDACWQAQLPAVQAMNDRLVRARADATTLGLDPATELRDLPERVRNALGEATTDPVGHEPSARALAAAVDQLVDRLTTLRTQRDRLGDDLAAAREQLVKLRLLAARAHRRRTDGTARVDRRRPGQELGDLPHLVAVRAPICVA